VSLVRSTPLPIVRPSGVVGPDEGVVRGRLKTQPGELKRLFWHVPHGATWADLVVRGFHADRPRIYMVHVVQLQPHATHKEANFKKWLHLTLDAQTLRHGRACIGCARGGVASVPLTARHVSRRAPTTGSFPIMAGATMELCIAHYWSSLGAGDLEYELRCHGLALRTPTLELHGVDGCLRVDVDALSREDDVEPKATLSVLRQALRPSESVLRPLPTDPRDALWDGRHIWERLLTYTFKIANGKADMPLTPVRAGDRWPGCLVAVLMEVSYNGRAGPTGVPPAEQLAVRKRVRVANVDAAGRQQARDCYR